MRGEKERVALETNDKEEEARGKEAIRRSLRFPHERESMEHEGGRSIVSEKRVKERKYKIHAS